MFVQSVVLAIEVGDIASCRTAGRMNGDRKFKSSLRPPRTGPKAEIKDRLEYYWKVCASLGAPKRVAQQSHFVLFAPAVPSPALHHAYAVYTVLVHVIHTGPSGMHHLVRAQDADL
jgi:hypothetical protein